jgi:hypothetical protein
LRKSQFKTGGDPSKASGLARFAASHLPPQAPAGRTELIARPTKQKNRGLYPIQTNQGASVRVYQDGCPQCQQQEANNQLKNSTKKR